MRELGEDGPGTRDVPEDGWGWIRVTRLDLADGTDLLQAFEFSRPDDGNPDDFTVARVQLPREVPPGAAVELELEFEAQLPRLVARTGYAGDFHFFGQWFPKLGVFEGERGWNCHQFHAASNFFADYGSYRVAVNTPAGWVIGATGIEVERDTRENGQRLVFAADRVHDFAWTAAPPDLMVVVEEEFEPGRDVPMVWLERARRALGLGAAELELPPTHLRLLLPRSQRGLAGRILRATRLGMAWYGLYYGPYPYPLLTVVVPPPSAEDAGGMEYPTLITTLSSRLLAVPPLDRLPLIEMVTIHEFGHQYFYGLLGSNEFERAWLDEGLDTYAEVSCMTAIAEDGLAGSVLAGGGWARARARHGMARAPLTIDRPSWRFRDIRSYGIASNAKTGVAFKTLEGLIGERPFATAMRTYAQRFRYRHPTGNDLRAVFEEVSGAELDWFFDQAIMGDAEVDWAILDVRNLQPSEPVGFQWDGAGWLPVESTAESSQSWTVEVDVGRLGDFVGPVEVLLRFADGSEDRRTWGGTERWTRLRLSSPEPLAEVVVDPDVVWALETRRSDNYWRDTPRWRHARRQLWWVVDALQLLNLFHLPWS